MIVFYDASTGQITGMSYYPMQRKDPYIKTNDPIAEQIFQKKLNLLNYYVKPYPKAKNRGKIVNREIIKLWVKDTFFCLPKRRSKTAEFKLIQDAKQKTITVKIKEPLSENKTVDIVACIDSDPFLTLWSIPLDLSVEEMKFNYRGPDNLSCYTDKIFKSYSHEQRS